MDQRLANWDLSLDEPLKNDSNTERIEFINMESDSSEDRMAKKEIEDILHTKVKKFKRTLNDRELEIFEQRIFSDSPLTLQEIGETYNISRERVRQIENNILKKMKAFFKKTCLILICTTIPNNQPYRVILNFMTKTTFHVLLILIILAGLSGCSRIQPAPVSLQPPEVLPAQPVSTSPQPALSMFDDTIPPGPALQDPRKSARYHYLAFLILHQKNRLEDALAALEKAIDLEPDVSCLKRDRIQTYLGMSRDDTALAMAETLVEQYPDDVENLLMLARMKKEDTREQAVYPLLQRILELDPDNRETYLRLGKIYMDNQQIPEALELFKRMAARMPDYYVAHFYLGEAYFLSGNHKEAEQAFQTTIQLEPDLIEPRFRLVDILQDPENLTDDPDPDQLLAMFEQILAIEPENDRALLETALQYHKTGQPELAAQQLMDLGNQALHDTRLLMTAVDLYLSQKRYADAVVVFSGMLPADPDNDNFNFFWV